MVYGGGRTGRLCEGVLLSELTHRLVKIKEWVESRDPQATVIPFSGALELKVLCPAPLVPRPSLSVLPDSSLTCLQMKRIATVTRTRPRGWQRVNSDGTW